MWTRVCAAICEQELDVAADIGRSGIHDAANAFAGGDVELIAHERDIFRRDRSGRRVHLAAALAPIRRTDARGTASPSSPGRRETRLSAACESRRPSETRRLPDGRPPVRGSAAAHTSPRTAEASPNPVAAPRRPSTSRRLIRACRRDRPTLVGPSRSIHGSPSSDIDGHPNRITRTNAGRSEPAVRARGRRQRSGILHPKDPVAHHPEAQSSFDFRVA